LKKIRQETPSLSISILAHIDPVDLTTDTPPITPTKIQEEFQDIPSTTYLQELNPLTYPAFECNKLFSLLSATSPFIPHTLPTTDIYSLGKA